LAFYGFLSFAATKLISHGDNFDRMQDIELMHMRYALESAVLALGAMEQCLGDGDEYQCRLAMSYLKDLQTHMEAISNTPRKVSMMINCFFSFLRMLKLYFCDCYFFLFNTKACS